ncbi:LysR substrate-binding domain-containing protein [Brevundimonas lenta]|uniref:DNA-binding transcriptional LysR family regulator n=1 Tax=Brevundimonas lenta TaxID=424796 RepID=A0A7W6JDJ2_9CAUL|nr:LysR substrate-binding domain-containing protein [Brevundimonas lenta]MBB4082171.1 DNA-binding transcriptional LysR family regulator [Brevundimonas lenta]
MFDILTPRESLPSLNGLRAFEAMGRTGSATQAGAELGVTHSAVSRQVKALEAALGVRLFEGPRHRLRLTDKGRELLAGLTAGFDALAVAVRTVRDREELHLAVHPSLAVKWLIPRLADFEARHPGIALHLSELAPEATRQRGADLLLRYVDAGALADPMIESLDANRIGLVCTPALAAGDLSGAARLTAGTRQGAWADWTTASGQAIPKGPTRTLTHLHFVLDAALAGLGVAVLPRAIVADDLAAGRLAAPYGFVPDGGALAVIRMNSETVRSEKILIRWLRDQARETGSGSD